MSRQKPIYVHLFHGYDHPEGDATKSGGDGPIFASNGNIIFAPETIEFEEWETGQLRTLQIVEGSVFYDSLYFRSCSVEADPATSPIPFEPGLADWSGPRARKRQGKYAQLSDKDRIERIASLLAGCIEERLSLLRTVDESERDYLLTSDIDDQIGNWEWVRQELIELRSAG